MGKQTKVAAKLTHFFVAIFVILGVLLLPKLASAQSNGLGVTPKESFTMRAGQTASNVLYLTNLNKTQPLTVHVNIVDFEALDETGAAKLLQSSDQPQTPWSLKPYLTLPEFVTVPPGETKQIPFTIKVPASIGAGTFYSAVEYTATTGSDQQQVNVAASGATLLFINIPGKVTEQLTMKSFNMTNKVKPVSVFHQQPTYFEFRIKNSGNAAESPAGTLIVKNLLGHTVGHVSNANPKAQIALIGQTRKFDGCNLKSTAPEKLGQDSNCTPFNIKPGYYSASLVILYGQNGQETRQIGATTHFWYLPWSFVLEFIIALAALVAAGYWLVRRTTRR